MPDGVRFLSIEINPSGFIDMLVEHEDLPMIGEGARAPLILPTITREPERFIWRWNADRPFDSSMIPSYTIPISRPVPLPSDPDRKI
jgi:hypothetical protein